MANKDKRYFSEIMNTGADMQTDEDDEEKSKIYKEPMRRNLLDVFDKTVPVEYDERMNVFLRIRPFSQVELDRNESQGCVEFQSNLMVSANAPKDSHTYKAQIYGLNKARHNFTFSRVFPEMTTQKEFFDCTMLKLVQDFIEGQNCLVFTYGVTNSGKTYTIQGNPKDAGVLPRGLDVLFNSINGKQWPRMNLKPKMFCNVVQLSLEEEEKEKKLKEHTLKLNSTEDLDVMTLLGDDASDQSVINALEQADVDRKGSLDSQAALLEEIENRVREETAVDVTVQGKIRFSVWVSFAEIYNEQIFDLLEPVPKNKDFKRPVLKLADDTKGSPYIKGLKEINVSSADEAYKLLTIGQRNLRTACTRLNQCSSRSHCIFNIKLIRVHDNGHPQMARVSMLSLCDLAGSERQTKTCAGGERLKEAGNINTSLLTLGRCIELLRYNQNHKDKEKIIPFRDSRLTRLFQNFFCGRGKAAMIVNVSQCASTFDETLNVFKFSAIAKQVVMPPKPVEKPMEIPAKPKRSTRGKSRASSICWESGATPAPVGKGRISRLTSTVQEEEQMEEGEDETEAEEDDETYVEELESKVEELENKLRELRRGRLTREVEIRREVCQEMQEQFVKIEDMYNTMLRETREEDAARYEKKIKLLIDNIEPNPPKRPRLEDCTCSVSSSSSRSRADNAEWSTPTENVKSREPDTANAELQLQVTQLEFQAADLATKNKHLEQENQTLDTKIKHLEQQNKAQSTKTKHLEQEYQALGTKTKHLEQELHALDTKNKQLEQENQAKAELARHRIAKADDDLGQTVLLETLSKQLQNAHERLKEQEKTISELNEMLTDAGEAFRQKEEDITKLKQAISECEDKTQQQVETIRELRALLEESKAAIEETDRRLDAKNRCMEEMKGSSLSLSHQQGTPRKLDAPIVLVTPLRNIPASSVKITCVDSEAKEFSMKTKDSFGLVPGTPSPVAHPRTPFTAKAPGLSSNRWKEGDLTTTPMPYHSILSPARPLPLVGPTEKAAGIHGQEVATPEVLTHRTEKNKVLRVVVTPIQRLMGRHTKASLLRLKLTPTKSPATGSPALCCSPLCNPKVGHKRKISQVDCAPAPGLAPAPVSLLGKPVSEKTKENKKLASLKKRVSNVKYNLRSRR